MLFFFPDKPLKAYNNSLIKFIFSFKCNTLSYQIIDDLIVNVNNIIGLDFRYHLIHGQYSFNNKNEIIKTPAEFVVAHSKERFVFGNPFHYKCPPMQIHMDLTMENSGTVLNSSLISKILQLENFVSVYMVNSNYFFLQQSLDVENFERLKVPLDGIHFTKSDYGSKIIDIKKNLGYSEVITNTWLIAGWKMWFRNDFFYNLIGKQIYDFPFSFSKSKDDFTTFIQLYENHNEPHFKLSRKRQKQFKEWIEFDKLIEADRAMKE